MIFVAKWKRPAGAFNTTRQSNTTRKTDLGLLFAHTYGHVRGWTFATSGVTGMRVLKGVGNDLATACLEASLPIILHSLAGGAHDHNRVSFRLVHFPDDLKCEPHTWGFDR